MRWFLVIITAAFLAAPGCGKDSPEKNKSDKTTEKKTADESATSTRTPATKARSAATAANKTLEPTTSSASGKKTEAKTSAAQSATDKPSQKQATSGEGVTTLGQQFPADAVAILGIQSLDSALGFATKKAKMLDMPLNVDRAQILSQVQSMLTFKSMAWLDTSRAIFAVVWNPKKLSDVSQFIPITSADALASALPDSKKANVDGNAYHFSFMGKSIYVNFAGKYVVVSQTKDVFGQNKAFLTRLATTYKPSRLVEMKVALENLKTIYSDQVKMGTQFIDTLKDKVLERIPGDSKTVKHIVGSLASFARTIIDEAQGLEIAFNETTDGVLVATLTVDAKAGGKLAGYAQSFAKADLSALKNAPQNAWLIAGAHVDTSDFGKKMAQPIADVVGGLLDMTDTEKESFVQLQQKIQDFKKGAGWFAMYADGTYPAAMQGVASVTDGAQYQKTSEALMSLIYKKVLAKARELFGAKMALMTNASFTELIGLVNTLIKDDLGVELKVTDSTEAGVTTQALEISADTAKLSSMVPAWVLKAFGNKLQMALGYGPRHAAFAMGPNGFAHAKQAASGTAAQPNPTVEKLVSELPPGTAIFLHADLAKAIKALGPFLFMMKIKEPGTAERLELGKYKAFSKWIGDRAFAGLTVGGSNNTLRISLYGTADVFVKYFMLARAPKTPSVIEDKRPSVVTQPPPQ